MVVRSGLSVLLVLLGSSATADPGNSPVGDIENRKSEAADPAQTPEIEARSEGNDSDNNTTSPLFRAITSLEKPRAAPRALRMLVQARKHNPELLDYVHFYRGEALMAARRYQPAAQEFARAMRAPSSRWVDEAWRRQADALRLARQPRAAARLYEGLLKSFPDHPFRSQIELSLALCWQSMRKARAAALQAQHVWLTWPGTDVAERASRLLARLQRRGVRIAPATLDRRLARIKKLAWLKHYDDAIAELQALARRATSRRDRDRIARRLALVYHKADRPADAVPLLEDLHARQRGSAAWSTRRLLADVMAHAGNVGEAVDLVLRGVPIESPKRAHSRNLSAAVWLLSRHGRYQEALRHAELLAKVTSERAHRQTLAWLAYRSGDYDLAIERFSKLVKGARDLPYLLYWQARAHAKAGRLDQAENLYRQLLEQHLRTYYGHLARSRLVELDKLEIQPRLCPRPALPPEQDLSADLESLAASYGHLLPGIPRSLALWRQGLKDAARRELRLVAMDLSWALHRNRLRQYRIRTWVERLWRGRKFEGRRWKLTRNERAIRRIRREDQADLIRRLGDTMAKAGLSYFGWRMGAPDPNVIRNKYPRAFMRPVLQTAAREDLDPYLLWSIMRTESAYRPDAISRVYAGGLMQLMPHTARRLADEMKLDGFSWVDVFEPQTNVRLAGFYLRALKNKFHNQLPLVAAAYNGGPHNVARWLKFRGAACNMDEFIEEIPFRESRRYAKKIVRLQALHERAYCDKDDQVLSNRLETRFSEYPNY